MARVSVGSYGPHPGFDVGDLARRKYVDVIRQKAGLWHGDRLLDVQAGFGAVSHGLARAFTKAHVFAVEMDAERVTRAALNAQAERLSPSRLVLMRAAPWALPFADEAFPVTTCALGLSRLDDPEATLAEMHRVTEYGGKCLVVDVDLSRAGVDSADLTPNVLDDDLFEAMKDLGWGKVQSQRLALLRGGGVLRLVTAKRFDPPGYEPPVGDDEDAEAWDEEE